MATPVAGGQRQDQFVVLFETSFDSHRTSLPNRAEHTMISRMAP
jgi:hypothetical protein